MPSWFIESDLRMIESPRIWGGEMGTRETLDLGEAQEGLLDGGLLRRCGGQ